MKKEYKDLELETVRFDAEDVITASGGCDCDCPTVKVLAPCPFMPCPDAAPCPFGACDCDRLMECIVG